MPALHPFQLTDGAPTREGIALQPVPGAANAVRVALPAEGGHLHFRGPAASGDTWPHDGVLSLDVYHELPLTLAVQFLFGEAEDAEAVIRVNAGVLPFVRTRVLFPLSALNAETVFIPRTPGRLKMVVSGRPTSVERVAWVRVGVGVLGEPGSVELRDLQVLPQPEVRRPEGPVVVDALGQWTARHWPGKTSSPEALCDRLRAA
ncbi:MAG: hypothetical protein QHJ73_19715, partial [Armatimonadota bacterium]|nr:hypothetical protein [Armatimonadota bacterium]